MRSSSLRTLLLGAAALVGSAGALSAQEVSDPQTNSPFSRFGIGDLGIPGYATQSAMGGIGLAFSDNHIANPLNPASLGALRFATYQVGVNVSRDRLTAGDIETDGLNGNLGYLSLAFTTRNTLNDLFDARQRPTRYATSISVTPYSTQGYNIQLTSDGNGATGEVRNSFLGTGGFYRLRSSHALEIGKRLRLGLQASYIFGRTNSQVQVQTVDLPASSVITDTESFRVRGVEIGGGGQYDFVLAELEDRATKLFSVGGTVSYTGDLTGSGTRTVTRLNAFSSRDTLPIDTDASQRVTMPLQFGVGVLYRHVNHLRLGADFTYATWDRFVNTLRPDERLESGYRLGVGGEWIPDYQSYNKYHNRVHYRFGAYLHQDPRPGVTADQALTIGFGFPVVRPREELSYVNLSINAGRLVTTGDIDQRYLRLTVGFALTDNSWFYKRRFK